MQALTWSTRPGSVRRGRRPSLLDLRMSGDPWMGLCTHPGLLVLYMNNQPVALQPGTPLEQVNMNRWIFRLQHSYPRKTSR